MTVAEPSTNEGLTKGQETGWDWRVHFGQPVDKDSLIWKEYVKVANAHDSDVITALNCSMDILLVFSGLFSAVVTTFIIQVEQALQTVDPTGYTAKLLHKMFHNQTNVFLRILDPTLELPTMEIYEEEDIHDAEIKTTLWYISLGFALLVAGGAFSMKQWLLEYQRRRSKQRAPYHQAIHHQQAYSSLHRWYIQEFGDLLASILLLDLVPFLSGLLLHLSTPRMVSGLAWGVASLMLALYASFLGFTIIVGTLVPNSAYRTPMSNVLKGAYSLLRRNLRNPWYLSMVGLIIAASVVDTHVAFSPLIYTLVPPLSSCLILPLCWSLWLPYRTSQMVGITGVWILYSCLQALSLLPPSLSSFLVLVGITFVIFIVCVLALSNRLPSFKAPRNFPATDILISVCGAVTAIFFHMGVGIDSWYPVTCMIILCGSQALLSRAILTLEVEIEDTTESEALAWLINQASDTQTLHAALSCIPSIGDTPLRRRILFNSSIQGLAFLIDSLVDVSQGKYLAHAGERFRDVDTGGVIGNRNKDRELRLAFYLTCLTELSQITVEERTAVVVENEFFTSLLERLFSCCYLVKTSITPSIPDRAPLPNELQSNLNILSTEKDLHLSALARAALSQLYPQTSKFSLWATHRSRISCQPHVGDIATILVEIRMSISYILTEHNKSKALEPSVLRYLRRYCIVVLDQWKSGQLQNPGNIFEAALDLVYIVIAADNCHTTPCITQGSSTPCKAAHCIMELKGWLDRSRGAEGPASASDAQLLHSLFLSVISATDKYLKIFAGDLINFSRRESGESSILTGMKLLDYALLEVATQGCCPCPIDNVLSAITTFYSIDDTTHISTRPLEDQHDPTTMFTRLAVQAAQTATSSEKVGAIRAAGGILNKISNRARAWSLAMAPSQKGQDSLPAIIGDMTRDGVMECRLAAFTAILSTDILCPSKINFDDGIIVDTESAKQQPDMRASSHEIHLTVLTPHGSDFRQFYEEMAREPSPLFQAIDSSSMSNTPLDKDLISKSITITSLWVQYLPQTSPMPAFLQDNKYPKALASIAAHHDIEMVPISTRASAIHLFARLWSLVDQKRTQSSPTQTARSEDLFNGEAFLGDIANALKVVASRYESVTLECIEIWAERLEAICGSSKGNHEVAQSGLVEALMEAVLWSDLGEPVEESRERLLVRLIDLKKKIAGSASTL